jgi:hypothetical protein
MRCGKVRDAIWLGDRGRVTMREVAS